MVVFCWLVSAIACAAVASHKSRSAFGWFVLGFLFSLFALLVVVCLPSKRRVVVGVSNQVVNVNLGTEARRACPDCAEFVRAEAIKCRFCGSNLKLHDLRARVQLESTERSA